MNVIDWDNIETVIFDMDGVLLDLHFDTYFWTKYLPMLVYKNKDF